MLKMFHRSTAAGGSAPFWREVWSEAAFEEALRFCELDPLRPLMARHIRPGQILLEGGCGIGQYVAYHSARGVRAVGLDFERECLAELGRRRPELRLCIGDVALLPLGEAAVDVYYSGGVVEHFERGPEPALLEARRVLRDDGVLLVSVPYLNPLRRLLTWWGRPGWHFVPEARESTAPEASTFFQYAFTPREFRRQLEAAGFQVLETQPYAVLWGLAELPVLKRLIDRLQRLPASGPESAPAHAGARRADPPRTNQAPSLAKRLLVCEDPTVPLAGVFVRLVRWAAANMMMYVCVRRAGQSPARRIRS